MESDEPDAKNEEKQSGEFFDYYIVDEASMVSIELCSTMVDCIGFDKKSVCFFGDAEQLPSIDVGALFRDLVKLGSKNIIPMNRLVTSHRNSGPILLNANRVLKGERIDFDSLECGFVELPPFVPCKVIANKVMDTVILNMDPMPMIICRTNEMCSEINTQMQALYNPEDPSKKQINVYNQCFRVGDKVMNTKNRYLRTKEMAKIDQETYFNVSDDNVMNGEQGVIIDIIIPRLIIVVSFKDKDGRGGILTYGPNESLCDFSTLTHAWACSIHKAQGDEYEVVYAVMPPFPSMLMGRAFLYTAMTRAKGSLILFGNEQKLYEESNDTSVTMDRLSFLENRFAL
jgi:exodeoxyribonuclease V alpha subunit